LVLDLVTDLDEELDVAPDGVRGVRVRLAQAARELPRLNIAVAADEVPVVLPVAIVDAVAREPRVQDVQPGQVHVHDEALQAALGRRSVVEVDRQERLAAAGLEDVPPLRASGHAPSLEACPLSTRSHSGRPCRGVRSSRVKARGTRQKLARKSRRIAYELPSHELGPERARAKSLHCE
jgi:hypothetical protein